MRHWLMKSEPSVYSMEDLERDGRTSWEGVRNYQARNLMQEMEAGDRVLFYHSNASPPAVVGLARVVREAYPDPTQFDRGSRYYDEKATRKEPRWFMVDVEFEETLPRPVPLAELKEAQGLEEMVVTRRSRLSVQPVTDEEFEIVLGLGRDG